MKKLTDETPLKTIKVRAKGWNHTFNQLEHTIDLLISMTPTSELRIKLTELNIQAIRIRDFANKQKEVL